MGPRILSDKLWLRGLALSFLYFFLVCMALQNLCQAAVKSQPREGPACSDVPTTGTHNLQRFGQTIGITFLILCFSYSLAAVIITISNYY